MRIANYDFILRKWYCRPILSVKVCDKYGYDGKYQNVWEVPWPLKTKSEANLSSETNDGSPAKVTKNKSSTKKAKKSSPSQYAADDVSDQTTQHVTDDLNSKSTGPDTPPHICLANQNLDRKNLIQLLTNACNENFKITDKSRELYILPKTRSDHEVICQLFEEK